MNNKLGNIQGDMNHQGGEISEETLLEIEKILQVFEIIFKNSGNKELINSFDFQKHIVYKTDLGIDEFILFIFEFLIFSLNISEENFGKFGDSIKNILELYKKVVICLLEGDVGEIDKVSISIESQATFGVLLSNILKGVGKNEENGKHIKEKPYIFSKVFLKRFKNLKKYLGKEISKEDLLIILGVQKSSFSTAYNNFKFSLKKYAEKMGEDFSIEKSVSGKYIFGNPKQIKDFFEKYNNICKTDEERLKFFIKNCGKNVPIKEICTTFKVTTSTLHQIIRTLRGQISSNPDFQICKYKEGYIYGTEIEITKVKNG